MCVFLPNSALPFYSVMAGLVPGNKHGVIAREGGRSSSPGASEYWMPRFRGA
jgi:hypothetical protein